MKNIDMNLVANWQDEMIKEMREASLRFSDALPKDSLIIKYFTYLRKKGDEKPKNIHKSKEFTCPAEYQEGLGDIERILTQGEDISPYLSKDVDKLKNDLMFNDWGVLHLHLGKNLEENNKYIERTGPLLFIYSKESNVYFINIFQHQEWTKKEVIQILYSNWPELLEPYIQKTKGFKGLEPQYTEEQHLALRKQGMVVFLELTDEEGNKFPLMPPGMGIATSGDAINDVRAYQEQINTINNIEDNVKNNISMVEDVMKKSKMDIPETFKFKLIYQENKWLIEEENTKLLLDIKL